MKKILAVTFAVLFLIGACFTSVFAADKDNSKEEIITVADAKIINQDDKLYLSVDLVNVGKTELVDVQCYAVIQSEEIVFAESTMASLSGYAVPYAGIGTMSPYGSKTVLYELSECKNQKANLTLLVGFMPDTGDDVYAGASYEEAIFEDVLNQKYGFGSSKLAVIKNFLKQSGFSMIAENWKVLIMILISFVLIYLAIVKNFEPLLLLPIAFGMLLTNLPGAEMYHPELFEGGHIHWDMFNTIGAGLLDYLYLGIKLGIYPCLIFLGIGAMTDFGPLIANPKSLLLGAAAQFGRNGKVSQGSC